MQYLLPEKFTVHIPHYRWNGKPEPIDYQAFIRQLAEGLESLGIDSFYTTPATGYYKGRSYDETLLTLFCTADVADAVAGVIENLFRTNNHLLQQEAFAFERNGVLWVGELSTDFE